MRLMLENLPPSLRDKADALRMYLIAFDLAISLEAGYLFGSHARGDARPDSDMGLCLLSEGTKQ